MVTSAAAWSPSWPSSYDARHSLDALLLALASSTDNFTVGLSMGIQQTPLPLWANACISVCNATGAWSAGYGGLWLSRSAATEGTEGYGNNNKNSNNNTIALFLSALAFGGLAVSEWRAYKEDMIKTESKYGTKWKKNDDYNDRSTSSTPSTMTSIWTVVKLAVPIMTLNNLAGEVAGGAAGLTPPMSALYALVASFFSMLVGYRVGLRLGSTMDKKQYQKKKKKEGLWLHPSLLSALLLGVLCLLTLQEAMFG